MANQVDNKFTWVISNFSSLRSKSIYSDEFIIGGCKWCLRAIPSDKIVLNSYYLSLKVADYKSLPAGWRRHARCRITVVNQNPEKNFKGNETQSWFDKNYYLCLSTPFVPLSKLKSKDGGFVVNNEVKIVAEVEVLEVVGKLDVTEEPEAATRPLKKTKLNVPQAATRPLKKTKLNVSQAATRPLKQTKLNDDGAVARNMLKATINVYGFQVLPSQVDAVRRIFKKHPDVALGFRAKNPILKASYMNVLLSLTEILRQLPREISKDDLANAYVLLGSLKEAGFKVDWLEKKVKEVAEKKENKKACKTRMLEIQKEWKELKAKVSAAKAPLTLDDVV